MSTTTQGKTAVGARIGAPGIYGEISDFLIDEAVLLDAGRETEWLDLLTDEIVYSVPGRESVYEGQGEEFTVQGCYFHDSKLTLTARIHRNANTDFAWERNPRPRTRRLVTNVIVHEGAEADEYVVTSTLLLLRTRLLQHDPDLLSVRRDDLIRRTDEGLRLAQRTAYFDVGVPGSNFLNYIF